MTARHPAAATRRRRALARGAALALACALAHAAPGAAQLLPLWTGDGAPAAPGSAVWRTLAWDRAPAPALATAPLAALERTPGVAIASEWAPLVRGADGSRLERASQSARFVSAAGAVRFGAEWVRDAGFGRGGDGGWGVETGGAAPRVQSLAAAWRGARGSLGAAVSAGTAHRTGAAIEASAPLAPGWTARVSAAQTPRAGELDVRWDDVAVAAPGTWRERRFACALHGDTPGGRVVLELEALDRVPVRSEVRGDVLADALAWRGVRAAWDGRARGLALGASLATGAARQRLEVRRDRTPYAVAAGPATEQALELRAGPEHGRWRARAFGGHAASAAAASLALWPFDGLAGAAGTRFAASTAFALDHGGVVVDGAPVAERGWDAGLAAWWLVPRGDFASWRAALYGLGRDDPRGSSLGVRGALLAGVRLARTQRIGGAAVRLECVQWAPLVLRQRGGAAPEPAGATTGEAPAPGAGSRSTRASGGTIVRVSIEP